MNNINEINNKIKLLYIEIRKLKTMKNRIYNSNYYRKNKNLIKKVKYTEDAIVYKKENKKIVIEF
jgi:hypothetical protein